MLITLCSGCATQRDVKLIAIDAATHESVENTLFITESVISNAFFLSGTIDDRNIPPSTQPTIQVHSNRNERFLVTCFGYADIAFVVDRSNAYVQSPAYYPPGINLVNIIYNDLHFDRSKAQHEKVVDGALVLPFRKN